MPQRQTTDEPRIESARIGPDDPRYRAVVDKRFNKRFGASPDYVRLVGSTAEVVEAVSEAVGEGRRLVVTSGGHCLEGFVSDPDVRVIIDVSPMKRVYHDAERRAVAVEAGATVGEDGRARSVVATREPSDPNRDLWWAHTGGGGGNFGIVTRYWFRSPDATGGDPAALLPRAPESITTWKAEWDWSDVDRSSFLRLLRNHGSWCERNSDADSPNASLWTLLEVHREQFGKIIVRGVSTAGAAAVRQVDDHLAALSEGIGGPKARELARMSWLEFALNPFPDLFAAPPGGVSVKVKDALLRTRLADRQIEVAYDWLTRTDHDIMGGMLGFATYGGRINTVPPDATASAQRGAILDMACTTGWLDPREEEKNLSWVRTFYRELFAASGGVPVPGEAYDGALINHPDTDLADPALNSSGVPWHTLYYKANYPRLQRIKERWDPRNVFRHALSIRPG
ncbi:MAG TPA: BBE domain-containing protein [Gemmatimonadaceae bacterium]